MALPAEVTLLAPSNAGSNNYQGSCQIKEERNVPKKGAALTAIRGTVRGSARKFSGIFNMALAVHIMVVVVVVNRQEWQCIND